MHGRFIHKVNGGKLIKVDIEHESGKISGISVCGDFFAYPEDSIEDLERRIMGCSSTELSSIVVEWESGVKLYGIDSKSIVFAIQEAMK